MLFTKWCAFDYTAAFSFVSNEYIGAEGMAHIVQTAESDSSTPRDALSVIDPFSEVELQTSPAPSAQGARGVAEYSARDFDGPVVHDLTERESPPASFYGYGEGNTPSNCIHCLLLRPSLMQSHIFFALQGSMKMFPFPHMRTQ
jgi:hypothetical protein